MTAENSYLSTLVRHFSQRRVELGLTGNNGWATHAIMQLCGDASAWADRSYPGDTTATDWDQFCLAFRKQFIPANALPKLRIEWDQLRIGRNERVAAFNDRFRSLREKLDAYSSLPDALLREAYEAKLASNPTAAEIYSMTAYLGRSTATLLEIMQQVADIDTTRHGSLVKTSLKGLEEYKKRDTPKIQLPPYIRCYQCGQKGHISRECPLSDDIRKLVEENGKEPQKPTRRLANKIDTGSSGQGKPTDPTKLAQMQRRSWRRGTLKVTREGDSDVDLGGKVESGSEADSLSSLESGSGKGKGRR